MLKNKLKVACILAFCILNLILTCFAQEEFAYDAQGRRNPFIPLVTSDGRLLKLDRETEKEAVLALEGIIYDKYGISYAIVNGVVVKVGDVIGSYQVLKVEKDKVIFIKGARSFAVELKEEEE